MAISGGLPPNHPFIDGVFHEINHPAMIPTMENPMKQRWQFGILAYLDQGLYSR
jgi:hypothetical protein